MKPLLRRLYHATLTALLLACGLAARLRRPAAALGPPRRLLVLRFGLLGDGTALLSPTLQRLRQRFPAAAIHVLATPLQRPLLEGLPEIDHLLTWTAGDLTEPRQALRAGAWRAAGRTLRALRRQRYDLALAVYGRQASAVALLCGAPRRAGYAGEAYPLSLTAALPGRRYDRPGWHEADYGVALADLAATGTAPARPTGAPLRLTVQPAARASLAALLPARANGPLLVLHTGATNGRAKRWPLPHWAELARRLHAGGATVVLAGGPEERAPSRAIRDAVAGAAPDGSGETVLDLSGRTSLPELLALLERADAFVSGDSGPLHLAVAVGRPVVAIHGPTDPLLSGPYRAPRAVVVRHDLPCSPCYRLERVADCPLGHTLCQRLVTPEEVHHAVRRVLRAGTGAAAG